MAKNWKNYYTDNAVHHLTGTVHQWQPILNYPPIAQILMDEISMKSERWNVKIWGYVIMPEHFHLLAQSSKGIYIQKFLHGFRRSISGKIKKMIANSDDWLKSYCVDNNIEIESFYKKTAGKSIFRFWKEKPRIFPISDEKEIEKKLRYLLNNPVRRGLVKKSSEWKYLYSKYNL